jgi:hypothetical protein
MKATMLAALAAIAIQLPLFAILSLPPLLIGGAGVDAGDIAFYASAVLLVATATVLLVGLPVFALLRQYGHASMRSTVLAGLVIGAVPILVLGWPLHGLYGGYSSGGDWFGHTVDFYRNGVPTYYAWLDYAVNAIRLAIHGAIGAMLFYWVWRRAAA